MTRRHWRNPHTTQEIYYGLGIINGTTGTGSVIPDRQGYISRTSVIPQIDLAVTILTNSADGWAGFWVDGVMQILRMFAKRGAPERRVRHWTGRWWSAGGAVDLVPLGNRIVVANPHILNPFMDATEIEVTGRDTGRISLATGFGSHGQAVRRVRSNAGNVTDVWLGGGNMKREKVLAAELERRYAPRLRRPSR